MIDPMTRILGFCYAATCIGIIGLALCYLILLMLDYGRKDDE